MTSQAGKQPAITAMTNHITTSQVPCTAGNLALAVYGASLLGIKLDAALISDPQLLAQRVAEALAKLAAKAPAKDPAQKSPDYVGV